MRQRFTNPPQMPDDDDDRPSIPPPMAEVVPDEEPAEDLDWVKMQSSNVDFIHYLPRQRILEVSFAPRGADPSYYQYFDVPPEVYRGMLETDSPGAYVWRVLRGHVKGTPIRWGEEPYDYVRMWAVSPPLARERLSAWELARKVAAGAAHERATRDRPRSM